MQMTTKTPAKVPEILKVFGEDGKQYSDRGGIRPRSSPPSTSLARCLGEWRGCCVLEDPWLVRGERVLLPPF